MDNLLSIEIDIIYYLSETIFYNPRKFIRDSRIIFVFKQDNAAICIHDKFTVSVYTWGHVIHVAKEEKGAKNASLRNSTCNFKAV
jgi:hypothetical protein